jgi:hypothetical protein
MLNCQSLTSHPFQLYSLMESFVPVCLNPICDVSFICSYKEQPLWFVGAQEPFNLIVKGSRHSKIELNPFNFAFSNRMQKYALSNPTILKIKMQFYQTLNYVSKNYIFLNHTVSNRKLKWLLDITMAFTAVCFNQREDSRHSKTALSCS